MSAVTAPPSAHQKILESWSIWIGRIEDDLIRGHLHQVVWQTMRDEIAARLSSDADASFLVSYSAVYVDGQVLRVRRLADTHKGVRSLVNLLEAMRANPRVMTRERYVARFLVAIDWEDPTPGAEMAAREWDDLFGGGPNPNEVDPLRIDEDRDAILNELATLTSWATQTVAHLDPLQPEQVPMYKDIPDALELLSDITTRYSVLLKGSSVTDWTPTMQGDWQAVFRPALFRLSPGMSGPPFEGDSFT